MNFLLELGHVWAVILGWETGKYLVNRIRLPYRWKCPECDFSMTTNSKNGFEEVKNGHKFDFHKRT